MNRTQENKNSGDLQAQLVVATAANRIARLLSKAGGLQTVIESLMAEFVDLVRASEGSIQLLRPSTGATRCTLIRRGGKDRGLLDKRLDDFMTGCVLKQKETLLTNDLPSLLELTQVPKRYAGVQSVLAAPLLAKAETIGVVNLIRTRDDEVFTPTDRQLVSSLAAQVGDFIEAAALREQLFDENQRLRKDLGDRFSVHGIIGQSPAIREVFSLLERVIPTDASVWEFISVAESSELTLAVTLFTRNPVLLTTMFQPIIFFAYTLFQTA